MANNNHSHYTPSEVLWGTPTKKSKSAKANLCEVSNHDWIKTAAHNVEVCSRSTCGIVRTKVKGHWRHTGRVRGAQLQRLKTAAELAGVTVRRLEGE